MKSDIKKIDNIYVLQMRGDINKNSIRKVRKYLDFLFMDPDIEGLLINFEDIHVLDSKGIGLILVCVNELRERGLRLSLCNVDRNIRFVLELVQIHKSVNVFNSEEEALEIMLPQKKIA